MSNQLEFGGVDYEIDIQAVSGSTQIAYFICTLKQAGGEP